MAGCCSGGACSSDQPTRNSALKLEQQSKDDSCAKDLGCHEECLPALEQAHDKAVHQLPTQELLQHCHGECHEVTVQQHHTNCSDSKRLQASTSEDLEYVRPSSIPALDGCSSSCCDERDRRQHGHTPSGDCHIVGPDSTYSKTTCLDDPHSASIATLFSPNIGQCSDRGGTCYVRKLSEKSDSNLSRSRPDFLQKDVSTDTIIDIEGVARITMDVQGMTCVGCEKNLIKALNAIRGISNIKTSLLGCKAEFDFHSTERISDPDMVAKEIERMTGFSCTRILDLGDKLELIIQPGIEDVDISLPDGVQLEYRGRDRVFVIFNPNSIGARDLLSHPSFSHAKLAPPRGSSSLDAGRAHLNNSIYMTLLSVLLTIPVLVLAYGQFSKHERLYGSISLILATIVQIVVGGPFYRRAMKTLLFSRMIEMDMLVVLSTTTAYIYSVITFGFMVHGEPLSTSSFFETSTLLVTIIMIGQTLGSLARQQAVESVSTELLQIQNAVIVDTKTHLEQRIDARLLQYGDTFKVLPEETVVTDGIILEGETELDESMITGEANLVKRGTGSTVVAGSINHSGTIIVQLTRLPSGNTIKTISALVDSAKSSKPKVQEIADVFASYFTPAIVVLTIIVFVIWTAIGIAIRHEKTSTACINAMTYAISTLIVSCPCAVGLAVPMVAVIACGIGARHGLILKSSQTLELGRKITHVVLDKTGTLTQGHPSVTHAQYFTDTIESLPLILGLTANSKHPVSMAITAHLETQGVKAAHLDHITSIPGSGIQGIHNGVQIRAGNQYWLDLQSVLEVQSLASTGSTIVCITLASHLIAIYGLSDLLRPEALSVLTELRRRGIEISLTSGDHPCAVSSIATQLNIQPGNVHARCTPASKATYIKTLQENCVKNTILYIGDGTNDAPALAQASIGIAFSSSPSSLLSTSNSTIATTAASTILLHPSLHSIITLIDLSHAFHRRVVFNFVWSVVYNVFAIALAAGVFESVGEGEGVRIQPRYAGLGELVSVVPVVGVAVSLVWVRL